jgi:glutaredoxin
MKQPIYTTLLIAAAVFSAMGSSQAQTIYRIVGADGKVTFSDKPPVSAEQGKVASTGVGAGGGTSGSALPFELRQVANKFPVTLYTSAECAPCATGRNLLSGRGVPFNERTVNTAEDTASLQRISGETSLPLLTVGGQKIRGFSDAEWTQYLDAAGYPKTSALPPGYRNVPASPLVSVQAPAAAKPKPEAQPEPTPAPPPQGPTPSNPAGITF